MNMAALSAGCRQAVAEAAHVRGARTGRRYLAWLGRRARWALAAGRHPAADGAPGTAMPAPWPPPPPRVAVVARGRGARLTLADAPPPSGGRIDLVVADTRSLAEPGLPAAVLDEMSPALAVPAFEPARVNPVGWTANVEDRVFALGPPALLPAGARAARGVTSGAVDALRHAHHVEDTASFHADASSRAGVVARLAGMGTPVRLVDGGPGLAPLLGADLHALMTQSLPRGDLDAREWASIRMRRLAQRDHALPARLRALCAAADLPCPAPPTVSVLLATRRPERLARALGSVAKQDYPYMELVLALHGGGFEGALIESFARQLPIRVVRVAAERTLGEALAAAARAARGPLLAKMDDDDVYGAEHLQDLVLAHRYSGAALVGKGNETAYLAGADATVRRGRWRAESYSRDIAGGALLIARADLERAGGWRPLPRGVDQALAADVVRGGGAVYRTHGAGFVLVRHGCGHAWDIDEARLLADADEVHRGWRPDLAGIDDAPEPPA